MTDLIKREDAPEPCPFCKCEKVTTSFDHEQGLKWGYASCDGCAARGPEVRTNWDREPDAPWHSEAIAAWNTRALPAVDRIEELVKERDDLGRKLNTARYGQPDFAWSIHEEAMADLRAKLTKAVEALQWIAFRPCSWRSLARAVLAELEGGK